LDGVVFSIAYCIGKFLKGYEGLWYINVVGVIFVSDIDYAVVFLVYLGRTFVFDWFTGYYFRVAWSGFEMLSFFDGWSI
jgi:hypothetical protein